MLHMIPVLSVTEAEPFGEVTVHYDQGVTGWRVGISDKLRDATMPARYADHILNRIVSLGGLDRSTTIVRAIAQIAAGYSVAPSILNIEQASAVCIAYARWEEVAYHEIEIWNAERVDETSYAG